MGRVISFLLGVLFTVLGVMGLMPQYTTNGMLFGTFEVDMMHNYILLLSGILALLASLSAGYASLYLKVFGIIFGILTILGFVLEGDLIITHANLADNVLHLLFTIIMLYFGFIFRPAGEV